MIPADLLPSTPFDKIIIDEALVEQYRSAGETYDKTTGFDNVIRTYNRAETQVIARICAYENDDCNCIAFTTISLKDKSIVYNEFVAFCRNLTRGEFIALWQMFKYNEGIGFHTLINEVKYPVNKKFTVIVGDWLKAVFPHIQYKKDCFVLELFNDSTKLRIWRSDGEDSAISYYVIRGDVNKVSTTRNKKELYNIINDVFNLDSMEKIKADVAYIGKRIARLLP